MLIFSSLKKGEILSESSYFVVEDLKRSEIVVKDSFGNSGITISKEYVEGILNSADQYTDEEKISQTELINIVLANPRTAMSIYFQKQAKKKTKKALKDELEARTSTLKDDFLNKGISALEEALLNPVLDHTPGEMRLIKGYYTGSQDERGRFQFKDMEDAAGIVKGVDSRTIGYVIVNNIKYSLKK